jgi:hypothetical protein
MLVYTAFESGKGPDHRWWCFECWKPSLRGVGDLVAGVLVDRCHGWLAGAATVAYIAARAYQVRGAHGGSATRHSP